MIPEKVIRARVREMGRRITREYRGRRPVLIGVLQGAFVFMSDLARSIDLPVTCDFIRVSSYGDSTVSGGIVRLEADVTQPIAGKDVILVEDIIDTGRTCGVVRNILRARKPRSLKVCCFLRKPARTEVPVHVDYVGFEIPNEFVVGYGLDCAGRYRNLRDVNILRK
ncbi:MAG: hypoxanthine phosphoribosyltransferase [Planctomycetota bacterium]